MIGAFRSLLGLLLIGEFRSLSFRPETVPSAVRIGNINNNNDDDDDDDNGLMMTFLQSSSTFIINN